MGRPSGFERDDVVDRAMELFWRCGYQGTSIPQLEEATGLGRGSLYNAFGDKEGLFTAALERYGECYGAAPIAALAHENPREGVRLALDAVVDRMSHATLPSGCLMANTTVERDAIGPRIAALLESRERNLENAFRATVLRGVRLGQLPSQTDDLALGQFFAAVVQGLAVTHRASRDVARLRNIVATAMAVWPARVTRRASSPRRPR